MGMFECAKLVRDELNRHCGEASAALRDFPQLANGLTPDSVRATHEWRDTKLRYDRAHAALQHFNRDFVKRWRKELLAERRAKRAA